MALCRQSLPIKKLGKSWSQIEVYSKKCNPEQSLWSNMSDVILDWYHVISEENPKSAVDESSEATGIVELRSKVAVVVGGNVKEFGVPDLTTEEAEDSEEVIVGECKDSDITLPVTELDVAAVS